MIQVFVFVLFKRLVKKNIDCNIERRKEIRFIFLWVETFKQINLCLYKISFFLNFIYLFSNKSNRITSGKEKFYYYYYSYISINRVSFQIIFPDSIKFLFFFIFFSPSINSIFLRTKLFINIRHIKFNFFPIVKVIKPLFCSVRVKAKSLSFNF